MKVIMLGNQKGGVAKTTTAFELSYLFATEGYKTLMIDLDAQCNLTTGCLKEKPDPKKNISNILMGAVYVLDAIVPVRNGLDIIPGSPNMLAERYTGRDDMYLLSDMRSTLEEETDYEYLIFDVGPQAGTIMNMALYASDYVITPANADDFSRDGVIRMASDINNGKKHIKDFNVKFLGVLLTDMTATNVAKDEKKMFAALSERLGAPIFNSQITHSCIVTEAKSRKKALNEYRPGSAQAGQYYDFAEEVLERIEKGGHKK